MAKHRGHGEGSIYQRTDKRWVGCITLENRKRKYFYGTRVKRYKTSSRSHSTSSNKGHWQQGHNKP